MREIKILHLYNLSMDLYGDYRCINAIRSRVEECGCTCSVTTQGLADKIDTSGYDLVYISHGKFRNMSIVCEHLLKYKQHIKEQIENCQCFFVTGSARLMFGKSFTGKDGKKYEGLGIFDYTAVEEDSVFTSDLLLKPVFAQNEYAYGFINRTEHITYPQCKNPFPLFNVEDGCSDGKQNDGTEGTYYKNFMATWCMGPALIRNPVLMKNLLKNILKDDYKECDYSLEQKALDITVADIKAK